MHDGLYDLDLSHYLLTADSSTYNLRQAHHQFTITRLRITRLEIFYFFRVEKSRNSLPLHLRKAESLNDLKDRLKSLLHSMNLFFLLL